MNKFIPDDSFYDNEYLITEDLNKYIKLAPIHNGKKVLSEKAWNAAWDKELGKYDSKNSYTTSEYREYMKKMQEFTNKYECSFLSEVRKKLIWQSKI